jgi:hypothetical protein
MLPGQVSRRDSDCVLPVSDVTGGGRGPTRNIQGGLTRV